MPFSEVMTDTVSLIKKDGDRVDNIKACVQSKQILIMRSDILIETGDLIQRKMSNGGEEIYEVIDPRFNEKVLDFPAHYQITHRKLGLPEAKRVIQNITYNHTVNVHGDNQGIASVGDNNINNNSEFNQKFSQLIQEIQRTDIKNGKQIVQDLNERKEDKEALQSYLGTLLTKGSEVATLVSTIGALLGMLG